MMCQWIPDCNRWFDHGECIRQNYLKRIELRRKEADLELRLHLIELELAQKRGV